MFFINSDPFIPGAVSGAAGAIANGQNPLRGAVIGAVSAAAFAGVGGAGWGAGVPDQIVKYAAMGLVGGITSVISGGNFASGFWSASVGGAVGGKVSNQPVVVRALVGAIVGGTISELTGGKFANGAVYGAFATMVQELARRFLKPLPSPAVEASVTLSDIEVANVELTTNVEAAFNLYKKPPPDVVLFQLAKSDTSGFKIADIWSELPYSDIPLYGDVHSMTGVEPSLSLKDLMGIEQRSQSLAIAGVADDVGGMMAAGTMACNFCAPVLAPIGLAATGVSMAATYSATRSPWDSASAAGPAVANLGTKAILHAARAPQFLQEQIGSTVEYGVYLAQ